MTRKLYIFLFLMSSLTGLISYGQNQKDALSILQSKFKDNHTKDAVRQKLDKVLSTYRMAISEQNYYRLVYELIEQRKRKNDTFTEMELADCVIEAGEKKVSSDVEFAAQLCAIQMRDETTVLEE